jgi:hypothetical protein
MAKGNGGSVIKIFGKVYAIQAHNRIDLRASEEIPEGAVRFSSETELAECSASWPARRLIEIWNGLPGVTRVSKFTDRKTAVRRIWQALSQLQRTETDRRVVAPGVNLRKRAGNAKELQTHPASTKRDQVIALLRRPEGATLKAIMLATDWQAHSVRGFVSGQLSKRMGLKVKSFKRDGERVYRIRS